MARCLLDAFDMKTFATSALLLLTLCAPALADTAQPPRSQLKIRFSVKEGASARDFTVVLPSDGPCASATQKAPDHEIDIRACPSHDAHLMLDWRVRGPSGEYHSTSSIPFERGTTAELGTTTGPRLTVAIE